MADSPLVLFETALVGRAQTNNVEILCLICNLDNIDLFELLYLQYL